MSSSSRTARPWPCGLRELLSELGSGGVPVLLAAGTEDGSLGTSYDLVVRAVAEADHGSGVVVLPDLGSSVLTAATALADHPGRTWCWWTRRSWRARWPPW